MDNATTLQYLPVTALVAPAPVGARVETTQWPAYLVPGAASYGGAATRQYSPVIPNPFAEHLAKLRSLRKVDPIGGKEVEAPSQSSIDWAAEVLGVFKDLSVAPAKVMPSAEGGVALYFVSDDKYCDIECLNTGEILGVVSNRHDRPIVWEVTHNVDSIAQAAIRIRQFLEQ